MKHIHEKKTLTTYAITYAMINWTLLTLKTDFFFGTKYSVTMITIKALDDFQTWGGQNFRRHSVQSAGGKDPLPLPHRGH
jgi:hypothetical protein